MPRRAKDTNPGRTKEYLQDIRDSGRQIGQGSTFTFTLPVRLADRSARDQRGPPPP